ncbi:MULTISPECIES: LytR/AlgR family response regulator transcription factor [Bacillus]|uniref:LytR/AlgR family response regulator transcription factor n=1 Tax=Bacillus TaxID=1386 RepID=UPI000BB730E5|nr:MULTISPECIES: LytTR family DNA-binding domain-containing protein [Bacillus]
MENYKIVIADDDDLSRKILHHFVSLFPNYEIVAEAERGDQLVELVKKQKPDIILVDINMPVMDGVEAVKECRKFATNVQVIFTTGYDEFAVEAFNISVADYLVKPIERIRLYKALEKAKISLTVHESIQQIKNRTPVDKLTIKSQNSIAYVPVDEILFIEKVARKTIIHLRESSLETTDSLQDLEQKLPEYFYKTHRSYIVNLRKIIRIESLGETFVANFTSSKKVAYISKLKITEVQSLISN